MDIDLFGIKIGTQTKNTYRKPAAKEYAITQKELLEKLGINETATLIRWNQEQMTLLIRTTTKQPKEETQYEQYQDDQENYQ